LFQAFRAC
jgi:dienelactone hydrolase